MDVEFADNDLDRLETDPLFSAGYSRDVVCACRKLLQIIRSTPDEQTFYALKSLHFERLKGDRTHQHSMRLNEQLRLIIEIKTSDAGKFVFVVGMEDYH